jgi:mono/diheme cytochrome c family protein
VTVLGWNHIEREKRRARAVAVAPQAREILKRQCYECHGEKPRAARNFYVLERSSLLDPQRKNVVPGHADQSRLIQRIVDGTMPPREKPDDETELTRVSPEELAILQQWIAGGAPEFPPEDPQLPTPPVVPYSDLAAQTKAIFITHCYECHQLKEAKGGITIMDHNLLLHTRAVVIPGKPKESEVYQLLVTDEDDPLLMPPKDTFPRMTDEEIDTVRRWIEAGAPPFPATRKKK